MNAAKWTLLFTLPIAAALFLVVEIAMAAHT
jgi:hypothetical protein